MYPKYPITVFSHAPLHLYFVLQLASSILAALCAYAEYTCLEKEAIYKVQGLFGRS